MRPETAKEVARRVVEYGPTWVDVLGIRVVNKRMPTSWKSSEIDRKNLVLVVRKTAERLRREFQRFLEERE